MTIEERKWIPCSERLPKSNGVYIVTRTTEDGFTSADIVDACYFDGSNTWHDDTRVNHGRKYLNCITAWMPLPKPYREKNCQQEGMTFKLNHPLTEEQWDAITDVDMEHTPMIEFHTKNGKIVKYRKVEEE